MNNELKTYSIEQVKTMARSVFTTSKASHLTDK